VKLRHESNIIVGIIRGNQPVVACIPDAAPGGIRGVTIIGGIIGGALILGDGGGGPCTPLGPVAPFGLVT